MLRLQVEVRGAADLARNLGRLSDRARTELERALDDSGNELRDEVVTSILQGEKSGRVYEKYDPRRTHTASAPGEAPASDTGYLVGHIVKDTSELPNLEIAVVSTAPYSEALEYGTRKMAPRPFMRPALQKLDASIRDRLADAVDFAVRSLRRR